jgi:hypothetical protein
MAKGQQKSNRETKKPKAAKLAATASANAISTAKGAAALMTRGTVEVGSSKKLR